MNLFIDTVSTSHKEHLISFFSICIDTATEFLVLVACPRIYGKCEKYLNYSSRTENVTVHNCHYRCKKLG